MLVPICRRHFHHLAPWQRKTDRISEPPQWIPHKYSVHNRKRPPSILGHWHLQGNGRLPRSESIRSPPTPFFIYTGIHIIVLQTNNQSSLPWYTEPKFSLIRIPLLKNWNILPPFSRIMDTALSRYEEPLNLQHGPPRPTKDPPRLHSNLTPKQHIADSAECWLNTRSEVSLYHQGKSTAIFRPPRMPCN